MQTEVCKGKTTRQTELGTVKQCPVKEGGAKKTVLLSPGVIGSKRAKKSRKTNVIGGSRIEGRKR